MWLFAAIVRSFGLEMLWFWETLAMKLALETGLGICRRFFYKFDHTVPISVGRFPVGRPIALIVALIQRSSIYLLPSTCRRACEYSRA
jgi:hypothetical protein